MIGQLLTVEHKYFDGMTDAHIQAVSFNGGGDFRAVLRGVGHEIPPLSLVKVYGTIAAAKDADMPCVNAVFVRDWHWGTFTFLAAYGTQKGSEKWRKQNRVPLDNIYDPYPDNSYYEQRLGKRTADDPLYRRLLKPAGELKPDTKRLMIELIDSLDAKNLFPVVGMVETIQKRHEERAAVAVLLAAIKEDEIPSWSVPVRSGPARRPRRVAAAGRPVERRKSRDSLSCDRRSLGNGEEGGPGGSCPRKGTARCRAKGAVWCGGRSAA